MIRKMRFESKCRACPEKFLVVLPPESPTFLPFTIATLLASTTRTLTVDHCNCFISACRTYLLQVYTAHSSYFDVSIISFTNALAGGGSSRAQNATV